MVLQNRNFDFKIYHRKFWDFIENPDYRDTDLELIAVSADVWDTRILATKLC